MISQLIHTPTHMPAFLEYNKFFLATENDLCTETLTYHSTSQHRFTAVEDVIVKMIH